ncbi:MAG: hypothetical protein WCP19_10015 [Chloroflexota bacterium]
MIVTFIHSTHHTDQLRVQLRCRNFVDAVNRIGSHSANLLDLNSFIRNTPEAQSICAGSDILVIHRYLYGPVLRAIQYWKARDKKVVVDFDLAINFLDPDYPGYSFWMEGMPLDDSQGGSPKAQQLIDPLPIEQFKWGLGLVDAATVPTARLADDWATYTNVVEIPDFLNSDHYPALIKSHEKEFWIGLPNSVSHGSLEKSGLLFALENICKNNPKVILVINDLLFLQSERWNISQNQIKNYASNSFEEWTNTLPGLDLGLFPIYGDYDLRSSQIPILEYMISKVPWAASDMISNRQAGTYGTVVKNNSTEWETVITEIINHPEQYQKKAGTEPFLFALSNDVHENIDKVMKLYTTILNQM